MPTCAKLQFLLRMITYMPIDLSWICTSWKDNYIFVVRMKTYSWTRKCLVSDLCIICILFVAFFLNYACIGSATELKLHQNMSWVTCVWFACIFFSFTYYIKLALALKKIEKNNIVFKQSNVFMIGLLKSQVPNQFTM